MEYDLYLKQILWLELEQAILFFQLISLLNLPVQDAVCFPEQNVCKEHSSVVSCLFVFVHVTCLNQLSHYLCIDCIALLRLYCRFWHILPIDIIIDIIIKKPVHPGYMLSCSTGTSCSLCCSDCVKVSVDGKKKNGVDFEMKSHILTTIITIV